MSASEAVLSQKPALSAFSAVAKGMTLNAIYDRLGPPARSTGLSTRSLDYFLLDGSRIEIIYVHPQLIKLIHYRNDGTRMVWVPS